MIHKLSDALQCDAHSQFQAWRRNNPDGYFLNKQSSKTYMLHHVDCSHLGDATWEEKDFAKSLTKTPKFCSVSTEELEAWVSDRGATLVFCNDCVEVEP